MTSKWTLWRSFFYCFFCLCGLLISFCFTLQSGCSSKSIGNQRSVIQHGTSAQFVANKLFAFHTTPWDALPIRVSAPVPVGPIKPPSQHFFFFSSRQTDLKRHHDADFHPADHLFASLDQHRREAFPPSRSLRFADVQRPASSNHNGRIHSRGKCILNHEKKQM